MIHAMCQDVPTSSEGHTMKGQGLGHIPYSLVLELNQAQNVLWWLLLALKLQANPMALGPS